MIKKIKNRFIEYFKNIFHKEKLIYVVESADWSIMWDGIQISKSLNHQGLTKADVRTNISFLRKRIIHFGSINTLIDKNFGLIKINKSNKIVLTWFHVSPDDSKIKFIPDLNKITSLVHTSCKKTKNILVKYGLDFNKIVVIPLGVDLDVFKLYNSEKIKRLKSKMGISDDKIIIGSFQKDGNGWGEGLEPKMIKGPDIFCDVIESLSKKYNIHVLLTGPARGYVKKRLEKAGITYTHKFLDNYLDIVDYYNMLDLYIISSRVEGGPKAILECWATGIPVVSTKVGMVPDIASHGEDVFLTEIEDTDKLVEYSLDILKNNTLSEKLIKSGLESVKKYSWANISERYYNEVYSKLI